MSVCNFIAKALALTATVGGVIVAAPVLGAAGVATTAGFLVAAGIGTAAAAADEFIEKK